MPPSDLTGERLGPYVIEGLIGRGGMGEVYRAADTRKGRVVALKLLSPAVADNPAARDRFLRESRVAAQLNDPHVIPIHDWGQIDGRLFIDMRLVDGRDLRALLTETGPLPAERALKIVGQIADALDAAHRNGLYHRDVKPDNILVDDRDFAYLVDFGLAQADTDTRFTSTGTAIGSFGYMAPERFGDGAIGAPADIYALTCVLYECLAGAHPFASATTIERLIAAHLTTPPPRWGAAIDDVVARGMAKDPTQRHPAAGVLVADADAALRADPLHGPPTVFPVEPPTVVPAVGAVSGPAVSPTVTGRRGFATTDDARWDPTQAAPWAPPPRRSSPAIPIALATIVVLLVCLGVVGWAILSSGTDEPTTSAREASTLTTVESSTVGSTPPSPPQTPPAQTPPAQTPPTTAASPAPPPPIRSAGDLGLSVPITRPACDGTGIVVVGNAVAPGAYAAEVQSFLDRFPGASYLRTDQSCASLRQQSDDGNPIYAVYYVAGQTLGDICGLRNRVGGDSYGKWLDNTTDPASFITC
ncbi:serine/threonine-protein kinase [Gordonia alkanivorans]|uniref:serine/threonine-protein kinase n=1 Tax=Gordonia alkanivorans TaxID=84096 RepID=UPI00244D72DB|nr:serine/threonine-protein kinase [Gordonia alkanivorans]MDH3007875.1 serine/threonine-protein kinase [Gordonia alkanivorans]MDH3016764.1 serine/threonine-protein kinase [Gordonia alkanivorans]MDH3042009.1 serine/threonine-protein kinase [Gordonia alkanivorans]